MTISRPLDTEYAPPYAGYVARVPDDEAFDIFELLARQSSALQALLSPLTDEQAGFRPGTGEWSIKEVVGHINDTERVMACRALRFSRDDQAPLPGFEQDDYVREANFDNRTLANLLEEFDLLRRANLLQFNYLSPEMALRMGKASNMPVSVRALLYIMAGHVEHHIASLQTDYLPKMPGYRAAN